MKTLRRIANWIDFFVSLLAAVYLLTLVLAAPKGGTSIWTQIFTAKASAVVYTGLFLAILLAVGAVLRAVQNVGAAAPGRYLMFDTPNGNVSVRAGSVEEVLDRTVRDMAEVADAAVSLILPKGALVPTGARIRCRLLSRPNLLAIQDQVRAVVTQCYQEMFPGEEALPIEVSVERIIFESGTPKKAAPTVAEPPADTDEGGDAEPMRPQYPVET